MIINSDRHPIERIMDNAFCKIRTIADSDTVIGKPVVTHDGVSIIPIDSEHSAIFQCLAGNCANKIRRILLTASGGPFRGMNHDQLKAVTPKDALAHPNWVMGRKITIDSATMMNKGLEVIEARWLFGVEASRIEVVVHPQSVVHSMVEFEDGAVMAQLGESDMRVSIAYALTHPRRVESGFKRLDILSRSPLTFEAPDTETFPCLAYAYEALLAGGVIPTVLNSANEAAVELFLSGKILFTDISRLIKEAVSSYNEQHGADIGAILRADEWGRRFVLEKG